MKWRYPAAAAVAVVIWLNWPARAIHPPPGILAPLEPGQSEVDDSTPFRVGRYTLTPRAGYWARARVISTCRYRWLLSADLSPIDVGLGWGRMSDSQVLSQLDFSQRDRFLLFRYQRQPPIPQREMEVHCANTHCIPATPEVKRALFSLRAGQVVELGGYLVDAATSDGFRWATSLTRNDTGGGACELMWVKVARVVPPIAAAEAPVEATESE